MKNVDKLLKGILEEEMSAEMRTWLIELSLLIDIGNSTKTLADMFNKLPDTFTLKVVTI